MDTMKKDKIRQAVRTNYGKVAQAGNSVCCPAAAPQVELRKSGFRDIRIQPKDESKEFIRTWAPGRNVEEYVVSATIEAVKP